MQYVEEPLEALTTRQIEIRVYEDDAGAGVSLRSPCNKSNKLARGTGPLTQVAALGRVLPWCPGARRRPRKARFTGQKGELIKPPLLPPPALPMHFLPPQSRKSDSRKFIPLPGSRARAREVLLLLTYFTSR